jgi:hypothetical protein
LFSPANLIKRENHYAIFFSMAVGGHFNSLFMGVINNHHSDHPRIKRDGLIGWISHFILTIRQV